MARFIFQLESVLRQRQNEERAKQVAVAAIEVERTGLEDLIRSYQRDLTQEREELRDQLSSVPTTTGIVNAPTTRLDLRGVRFQAGASLRLVTLAQRAVLQLAGVHQRLTAARAALLEATTRRKAVETLRERRHAEWLQEQERAEDAAADELTIMRAGRQAEAI